MDYSVIPIERFKKEAKRLAKKYPSFKSELSELSETLKRNPRTGIPLGNNVFKVRLAIRSKGKGKSSGTRVITYLVTEQKEIYLLTIYDKSELNNIDDKTLKEIISDLTAK
jgi:hypothetical protein